MSDAAPADTHELLMRWHAGDRSGLDELLARDMDWITYQVRNRLGGALRARAETADFVQDAVIEILSYGPRFVVADRGRFRALVARMVENNLRDQHDWYHAQRRARHRESPLKDSVLDLNESRLVATSASQVAAQRESEAWLRLGLELLDPEDRQVILMREWRGMSFREIADELGLVEGTARVRFHRALPRLALQIEKLKEGRDDGEDPASRDRGGDRTP